MWAWGHGRFCTKLWGIDGDSWGRAASRRVEGITTAGFVSWVAATLCSDLSFGLEGTAFD